MTSSQKQRLLRLARESIAAQLGLGVVTLPDEPEFQMHRGVFVTLHKQGELRGCIGFIRAFKSIVESVEEMAVSAAFQDPRFSPVQIGEMSEIEIEISILSELIKIEDIAEIELGRDGLVLHHPLGSGVFLPQVPLEWNWDLDTYLRQLCRKAGLTGTAWKDSEAKLYRFTAEVFAESDILP